MTRKRWTMPGRKQSDRTNVAPHQRRGPRAFRFWVQKKRGSHTTGSSRLGGAGEALFFAGLFLVGVLALTQLIVVRFVGQTESFLTTGWGLGLSLLVLGSLITLGAVGAIYSVLVTGASLERRAALAKKASSSELLADSQTSSRDFPNIPKATNWTNSPGIRLSFRLPIASSPAWRLLAVACFCLVWNGAVAVLTVLAFNREATSGSPWMFRAMVLAYAIVGGYIAMHLFRLLLAAAAIGPTGVEVSAQPLLPGKTYRVFLAQAGHLTITWLELRLVCDEEVSYTNGTDTRVESKRVHDELVFRKEDFAILPSEPFQHECDLHVPESAMHSFLAPHNALIWKLVIRADAHNWPTFERVFPLVIYPTVVSPIS